MGNSSSQMDMRPNLRKCSRWYLLKRRKSLASPAHLSPPTLLILPDHIHRQIIQELGERDRKSLSIVCFQFLQYCEQTFERAPRIWNTATCNWATRGTRVIFESEYLENSEPPKPRWAYELRSCRSKPPPYTSQDESSRPIHFRSQRQQAQEQERLWLCPHVGCTFDNLTNLQETPFTYVIDTRSIACAFPKCALWVGHVTVRAGVEDPTRELCSVFRVYRIQCSYTHPKDLRQKLRAIPQDKVQNAMQHLQMPICRHLTLGSTALTAYFDPRRVPIIPQLPDINWYDVAMSCFDVGSCEDCESEGTYTTWGFFARPCRSDASHGGVAWLDIELALARPYMESWSLRNDRKEGRHWNAHSIPAAAMSNFVDGWWKWAEQVAVEGFDWRARLPSGFLEANRSACINFPELLPAYEEHGSDVGFAEEVPTVRTGHEPLAYDVHSTWGWRRSAGIESIFRFPRRQVVP